MAIKKYLLSRLHTDIDNKEAKICYLRDGMRKATDEPNRCEPRKPQLHHTLHQRGDQSGTLAATTLATEETRTERI